MLKGSGSTFQTREKTSCKTSFDLRIDGAEKRTEQGRDEGTEEDCRTYLQKYAPDVR